MHTSNTVEKISEAAKKEDNKPEQKAMDLEIKDAQLIFESVWNKLKEERGIENLSFPKEIFWLNGAPGSGKGTQTKFIMKLRDLTAPPIIVSDLLNSPEAKRMKDAGMMVGDREVTELIIDRLLDPVNQSGAIVDGFPRTKTQVHCLEMLYNKLRSLRTKHLGSPLEQVFHKPIFHIIVLFIDEPESVKRQLKRGEDAIEHNKNVEASGVGEIIEVRKTDLEEQTRRRRYRTFKEVTYNALQTLREVFHYHYINAHGSIQAVQQRILDELRYQSSLELDQATHDRIAQIPISTDLTIHARQELVNRLDDYESRYTELFRQVVEIVKKRFLPIVLRHSISGMAYINSEETVFEDPLALAMLIDVFSERGYHAVVDVHLVDVPYRFDLDTGMIYNRQKKVFRFRISFRGSEIRRGG